MFKTKELFKILLFFFTVVVILLFVYLFKIGSNTKHFHYYVNELSELKNATIKINTFFQIKNKLVNYDEMVKENNSFEENLDELIHSNLKKDFGENFSTELLKIKKQYLDKKEILERFKARQATNINSINSIYELNEYFVKDTQLNINTKEQINKLIFRILQYTNNIYDNKKALLQSIYTLKEENKTIKSNKISFLITHGYSIVKNIDYLNDCKNEAMKFNTFKDLDLLRLNLVKKYEENKFYQSIITLVFFLSILLMIYLIIKEHNKVRKVTNELFAFKYAVEISDNSIVITDTNKQILYVNDIFEKITGFKKEEVTGNKPKMLRSNETSKETYIELNKKLKAGEKWEGEFINRKKDGTIFYEKASIVPIYIDNELKNYLAIKLDITKYIEQNEEIKLSSIAFNNMKEGIFICDENKNTLVVNEAYLQMFGYEKNDVLKKVSSIFENTQMNSSLEKEGSWQGKVTKKRKDLKKIHLWLNIETVKDKFGKTSKFVGVYTNLEDIISSEKKAEFLSYHDNLTKLPNKAKLEKDFLLSSKLATRNKFNLYLLFIDLDRFKLINDTLGHSIGDKLLINIANRIKNILRETDLIARMGGDEFIVVLESCKDKKQVGYVCEKILNIIRESMIIEENSLNISASIGVATFPEDGDDITSLIKNADTAMYYAKDLGKNNYQYYNTELSVQIHEQLQIEQSLKDSIKNEEFFLNYQPQYNLKSQNIIAFEALVRWVHPKFGFIRPDKFIPIAEDTGDIIELGKFIFDTACKEFKEFKKINPALRYIAINISSIQFKDKDFLSFLINTIKKHDLEAKEVELEITERYIMEFTEENMQTISKLKEHGFRFSVDDFGTGYSSLSYLTKLPIDVLKVDKAFVDRLPNDNNNIQISKAIIALSKSLGYETIAEGIEDKEQENFLNDLTCDNGQGYLFSKPLKANDIITLLKNPQ